MAPLAVLLATATSAAAAGDAAALPPPAHELQAVWDANAAPGDGYDRLLDLDSLMVYTGGLSLVDPERCCIRGHGAILDLDRRMIDIAYNRTVLDLEDCVILNGGGTHDPAVYYHNGTAGHVRNCVFYGCKWGMYMAAVIEAETSITNCIFMNCEEWGLILSAAWQAPVSHCDFKYNGVDRPPGLGGDVGTWCSCPGEPEPYYLPAESQCMYRDPLFERPSADHTDCDFHLQSGSPCLEAGIPTGTDLGAYQDGPTPVAPATWGRIKRAFR